MHTTAHPDDEHGGLLARLSRGMGARVSLMTLNRGESGDNALGPQLFDGLGLIRTEELLGADQYYGVDAQYFTSVIDYGFSKRLDEALDKWGSENVLRDVVRIIRTERPLILVSRFQGNERDGHGNHQTAGLITQQRSRPRAIRTLSPSRSSRAAALAAAQGVHRRHARGRGLDGARRPRPVQPMAGDSYDDFARTGLSFQRSQNSGRLALPPGRSYGYYKRVGRRGRRAGAQGTGLLRRHRHVDHRPVQGARRPEPAGAAALLQPIAAAVEEAMRTFDGRDPSAIVPALARGLAADAWRPRRCRPIRTPCSSSIARTSSS